MYEWHRHIWRQTPRLVEYSWLLRTGLLHLHSSPWGCEWNPLRLTREFHPPTKTGPALCGRPISTGWSFFIDTSVDTGVKYKYESRTFHKDCLRDDSWYHHQMDMLTDGYNQWLHNVAMVRVSPRYRIQSLRSSPADLRHRRTFFFLKIKPWDKLISGFYLVLLRYNFTPIFSNNYSMFNMNR